ncbi:uncharacterized protein [Clytia hemisphaerica]|uniref:Uncharacterized protein n=1 Tax=Clytia hemisphaerica TaxID=252671 RepID=A0A7M5U2T9_9CNID
MNTKKNSLVKLRDEFLDNLLQRKLTEQERTGDIHPDVFERDLLSHAYDFAHDRGLKSDLVEYFVIFYQNLIADTVKQDLPLASASILIKNRIQELTMNHKKEFPQTFFFDAVNYITRNILQHYHLFVFAFCQSRQAEIHQHEVLVKAAPYEVEPLDVSQPISQWTLEKDLQVEEEKFTEEEQNLKKNLENSMLGIENAIEEYFEQLFTQSSPSSNDQIDLDAITQQIQQIITKHSEITTNEMNFNLERSRLLLLKNLKKAQLLHATNGGRRDGKSPTKTLSTAISTIKKK